MIFVTLAAATFQPHQSGLPTHSPSHHTLHYITRRYIYWTSTRILKKVQLFKNFCTVSLASVYFNYTFPTYSSCRKLFETALLSFNVIQDKRMQFKRRSKEYVVVVGWDGMTEVVRTLRRGRKITISVPTISVLASPVQKIHSHHFLPVHWCKIVTHISFDFHLLLNTTWL